MERLLINHSDRWRFTRLKLLPLKILTYSRKRGTSSPVQLCDSPAVTVNIIIYLSIIDSRINRDGSDQLRFTEKEEERDEAKVDISYSLSWTLMNSQDETH